ncbi:MAG TPA: glycerophosphodiester phosphodiesterase [Candidatus Limnocylindria bacterium]|nr:glycerophosphodiester phosphodiesterase [Candidatus Limnocylindria bacterium]
MTALRLAHRGDWRVAPENSLGAMEAAIGGPSCDGLEFDVRASADGVAVLLHDETLARVQRIPAKCVTLTAAELAGHGIPTLAQVLGKVGCEYFLDVELKEPVQDAIDVLELERGRVDDDGRSELRNAVLSAFELETLHWLADVRPTWPRWLNAYDLSPATIDTAMVLGCEAISADWHAIDAAGVARATDAGLRVGAWTVRDADTYGTLERLGVAAICAEAAALDG